MSGTHEEWQARQANMRGIILKEPEEYFAQGYTIAEFCIINSHEMLKKDPFCFAKAWAPFDSPEDPLNIKLLRIHLTSLIGYDNRLDENTKFKLIDAYPFVLENGIIGTDLPDSLIEAYHKRNARITEFQRSDFASALPFDLVALITSKY